MENDSNDQENPEVENPRDATNSIVVSIVSFTMRFSMDVYLIIKICGCCKMNVWIVDG